LRLYYINKVTVLLLCLIFLSGCVANTKVSLNPSPNIKNSLDNYSIKNKHNRKKIAKSKNLAWWKTFHRKKLNKMIKGAFNDNQDLKQYIARVKQAREIVTITSSSYLPEVFIEGFTQARLQDSNKRRGNSSIGGTSQWEIDAFGRINAAVKSSKLTLVARKEDVKTLKLSLSSEIARAYFGAIGAHQTLKLIHKQLKLDRKLLKLFKMRLTGGIGTNVELLQQKGRVSESESLIPVAQSKLRVFENRLDVLLGHAPDGNSQVPAREDLSFAEKLPELGVPSDLLLNRPDLLAAKAELVAVDADIAEAIAARMPRITLDASHVFSESASFVGPVSLLSATFIEPLLDWGKRRAEVSRNKALYEEKLALFTQKYLKAVEEVENAFYQEKKQREFLKKLKTRRKILQGTVDNTKYRYDEGLDDYLPVISALQELRNVERRIIIEEVKLIDFRINLYLSIGGNITKS